jgi:hypothetical protein
MGCPLLIFGPKAWNETIAYPHLLIPEKELTIENLKGLFGYKYYIVLSAIRGGSLSIVFEIMALARPEGGG